MIASTTESIKRTATIDSFLSTANKTTDTMSETKQDNEIEMKSQKEALVQETNDDDAYED